MQEIAREHHSRRRRRDVQSAKRWGNSRDDKSRRHAHDKHHQTPHQRHTSVITPHAVRLRADHAVRRGVDRTPRRAGAPADAEQEAQNGSAGTAPETSPRSVLEAVRAGGGSSLTRRVLGRSSRSSRAKGIVAPVLGEVGVPYEVGAPYAI
jgi:hypothetical protein